MLGAKNEEILSIGLSLIGPGGLSSISLPHHFESHKDASRNDKEDQEDRSPNRERDARWRLDDVIPTAFHLIPSLLRNLAVSWVQELKMEVKGLHTLLCEVSDMDRSIAFYRDILGLTVTYQSSHWSSIQLGTTRLGLHPAFERTSEIRGGGWICGLETDDILSLRQALIEAQVSVGDFHDTPAGAIMDFHDPDGNRLQAIQPGKSKAELQA